MNKENTDGAATITNVMIGDMLFIQIVLDFLQLPVLIGRTCVAPRASSHRARRCCETEPTSPSIKRNYGSESLQAVRERMGPPPRRARSSEFAATPPPMATLVTPVRVTTFSMRSKRTSTTAAWKDAATSGVAALSGRDTWLRTAVFSPEKLMSSAVR